MNQRQPVNCAQQHQQQRPLYLR